MLTISPAATIILVDVIAIVVITNLPINFSSPTVIWSIYNAG